ncbi:hypothetical protein [Methanococcus voltae]|uniref:Nucleic acid binding OB-fold tRNA/helicase-type n=1 Tax=Methanococcus voltae PS TaxID=523842 RepID=A0ABT2EUF7_METVO|nr:hypothetical protein [Methanococcus voltae]MBP2172175.1 hypothetical protein [Methanococcus voltae]MCS3921592.1 hypothetical protein [Methanococcus voltae PS]
MINITIEPNVKIISELNSGDYVKTTGTVYFLDYISEKSTYKIKICQNDEYTNFMNDLKNRDYKNSLILYPENNLKPTYNKYVYSSNISLGDNIEVIGKINNYMGYKIIYIKNTNDLKIISKANNTNNNTNKNIGNSNNSNNSNKTCNKNESSILVYLSSKSSSKVYHTLENCPYGKKIINKTYFNISNVNSAYKDYKLCSYCKSHSNIM